jgi:molybdopterin synthase catalytic subunit
MPSWCAQGDVTFLHVTHIIEVTESSVLVSVISVNLRQTFDSYITIPHMYIHGLERDNFYS